MEVRDLAIRFKGPGGIARAVDGVSLEWCRGEILGIVGESGCGTSTLARAMLGLAEPAAGEVALGDKVAKGRGQLRELRRRVQMSSRTPTRRSTRASGSARSSTSRWSSRASRASSARNGCGGR